MALDEITQEFESQRLQLQQRNQLADQAQRDKVSLYGELEMRNRLFREHQAKDCQDSENLRRIWCEKLLQSKTIDELSVHQEGNPSTVSQLMTQIRELQNKVNSLMRSWNSEQLWSDPRSQLTLYYSQSQNYALPRFWIAARYTEYYGYFRTRFWTTTCSWRTDLYSFQFQEFGNLLSRTETWYWRKYKEAGDWNETRIAKFVDTRTTLAKRGWIIQSYWWNLFSQWCGRLSEISDIGIASGEISWLYGIPKL